MYSSNHNDPENLHVEVANTKQEALGIIERLKTGGTPMGQIHLVGKDLEEFAKLRSDVDVDMHQAGNVVDKFKALFSGEDAVMEGLKGTDLPESQLKLYKQIVEKGGILIYMNVDAPDFEDESIESTPAEAVKELHPDYTYLDRRNYY